LELKFVFNSVFLLGLGQKKNKNRLQLKEDQGKQSPGESGSARKRVNIRQQSEAY